MEDVRIILSATWVALMLTYLLGDVLRIYAGDFKPGEMAGRKITQNLLLGIAVLMTIPILMVFLSLTLNFPVNRWANLNRAIGFFWFHFPGLAYFPSN